MGKNGLTDEQWSKVGQKINDSLYEKEKTLFAHKDSIYYQFVDEIRKLGFNIETTTQAEYICEERPEYTRSIVIKYYKKAILDNEKAGLMDCLINKDNKDLIPFFIEEFYKNKYPAIRNAIGNCLLQTADKKYLNEYLKMLNDETLGDDRAIITWVFEKLKPEEAIPILISFLDEDVLRWSALNTLNKYKNPDFLQYFQKYVNDKNPSIRNVAKKGIATIEKLQNK